MHFEQEMREFRLQRDDARKAAAQPTAGFTITAACRLWLPTLNIDSQLQALRRIVHGSTDNNSVSKKKSNVVEFTVRMLTQGLGLSNPDRMQKHNQQTHWNNKLQQNEIYLPIGIKNGERIAVMCKEPLVNGQPKEASNLRLLQMSKIDDAIVTPENKKELIPYVNRLIDKIVQTNVLMTLSERMILEALLHENNQNLSDVKESALEKLLGSKDKKCWLEYPMNNVEKKGLQDLEGQRRALKKNMDPYDKTFFEHASKLMEEHPEGQAEKGVEKVEPYIPPACLPKI